MKRPLGVVLFQRVFRNRYIWLFACANFFVYTVRYASVVRWFSRYVVQDYVVDGYLVPEGSRVMIMYQSANRDERHYPDADRFDVGRKPMDQLGWGAGPHMCAGMHLAKLEMEALLHALVRHVRYRSRRTGISLNRSLYTLDKCRSACRLNASTRHRVQRRVRQEKVAVRFRGHKPWS
jgi:hypothetical protein